MNNTIITILVIITLTTTWVDHVLPMLSGKLDRKPLNCSFCLSFWVVLVLFVWKGQWLILTAPLFLRIIERRLL